MLRISALNESGSDRDSEAESVQVETREAQEAHLLNLYTTALKDIAVGKIKAAKENLNIIVNSSVFKEDKEESLLRSLRYNVHKNLGECLLSEGEVNAAQTEMLLAADIDNGDVNLWFKIADTAVKLKNLYMCRSALEQGLAQSPNHWPTIDNLIAVTFKLGDYLACLGYCSIALEQDPSRPKAVLYKSKVYNEMPFLQEHYSDKEFVPLETEMDTYYAKGKEQKARPSLNFELKELTFESLASNLRKLSDECDLNVCELSLCPIDTSNTTSRLTAFKKQEEEAKIQVSVQNLVEEIIDIVAKEEEIQFVAEDILDDMLCDMFGIEPKKASEKMSREILNEILGMAIEKVEVKVSKKKSVVLDTKPKERKKGNALDEIPDELIEKRRSSRKSRVLETAVASDASNDPINIQTPRELLLSYLPSNFRLLKEARVENKRAENHEKSVKSLFENPRREFNWYDPEEERAEVEKFLIENSGKTIWNLMRAFLDFVFRLHPHLYWPKELAVWTGRVYESWRSHLGDSLSVGHPDDQFTQEFLRYYILGCECLIGCLLEENSESEAAVPESMRLRLEEDLTELFDILPFLTVDLRLRVHSLRFFFQCLMHNEDEILYESNQLSKIYEDNPDMIVYNFLPQYKVASKNYLEEYSSSISRNKELEELNDYYEQKRYAEIVDLLMGTLESTTFTPSKEAVRTPNRETQIDIFIESLFHVGMYVKCMKWSIVALSSTFVDLTRNSETGDSKRLSRSEWATIEAYMTTIECCIENTETKDLANTTLELGSKLSMILIDILSIQIDDLASQDNLFDPTQAWILLHKLTVWGEKYADSLVEPGMKNSLDLLCSAHDYLGQKSCCTLERGRLLNYILDVFIPLLTGSEKPPFADQIKTNLDQAIYCLFAHPSKKARVRHLADHNVSQVALSWERALKIFSYIRPAKIPEHDDVKLLSISHDTESFLKRLVALIPAEVSLEKRRLCAQHYVQGKQKKLKVHSFAKLPPSITDIFYLLADYAFKNSKDLDRAIDFYTMDISFSPKRYDSWAALALAQASKMDQRLNSCRKLVPAKMLELIHGVETCFKKCLSMNEGNSNLWIEFGNFSYNVHSYLSRTLQNNSEGMNIELFERLETKKEELLKTAMENYQRTLQIFEHDGIDENDVDERWLIYYMIGKIKEKSNKNLLESLKCYIKSMEFLERNGAILPKKVNYNSPQPLSIETLEIYYRVHASILKFLVKYESCEDNVDIATRNGFYEAMKTVQLSKVYNTNSQEDKIVRFSKKRKIANDSGNHPGKMQRTDETTTSIMRDVIEVMDQVIEEVEFIDDPNKQDVSKLIKLALMGLEDVAFHFFHHFKALYRLAHYFHTSSKANDFKRVQKLLLAGANEKNVLCPGLFFGRKTSQIFNDIWRIPISEIDRPGSFASHCSKSLMLLIDVLRLIPDLNTLADIALQLRRPPTEENKFVHESDRIEVGTMASTYLFNTIKGLVSKADIENEVKKPSLILDIFRVYQKVQKQWTGKDKEILTLLKELYGKIRGRSDKDKITNDEVFKYCNQEIGKQKAGSVTNKNMLSSNSSTSTSSNEKPSAQAVKSSTPTVMSQSELLKQNSSILAYLQKISNFQEMVAMSLPNMSNGDMAAVCDLKYEEQPRSVNNLFQQLLKMNQAQLKVISFDCAKLALLSNFAIKIGLVATSVNVYVSRLKAIMNGTQTVQQSKPHGPKKAASDNGKIGIMRKTSFKPKLTPGQRNLRELQLLLQRQDVGTKKAARQMANSPNVSSVSADQLKACQKSVPVAGNSNSEKGKMESTKSSITSEALKFLPAGITLTVEKTKNAADASKSTVSQQNQTNSKEKVFVPVTKQAGAAATSASQKSSETERKTAQNKLSSFKEEVARTLLPGSSHQTVPKKASVQRSKAKITSAQKPVDKPSTDDEPEIICID